MSDPVIECPNCGSKHLLSRFDKKMKEQRRSERLRLIESCLPIVASLLVWKEDRKYYNVADVAIQMANRILAAIDNEQSAEVPK